MSLLQACRIARYRCVFSRIAGVARPVSATRNMALDLSLVETACLALDVWRCSERIRAFKNA